MSTASAPLSAASRVLAAAPLTMVDTLTMSRTSRAADAENRNKLLAQALFDGKRGPFGACDEARHNERAGRQVAHQRARNAEARHDVEAELREPAHGGVRALDARARADDENLLIEPKLFHGAAGKPRLCRQSRDDAQPRHMPVDRPCARCSA